MGDISHSNYHTSQVWGPEFRSSISMRKKTDEAGGSSNPQAGEEQQEPREGWLASRCFQISLFTVMPLPHQTGWKVKKARHLMSACRVHIHSHITGTYKWTYILPACIDNHHTIFRQIHSLKAWRSFEALLASCCGKGVWMKRQGPAPQHAPCPCTAWHIMLFSWNDQQTSYRAKS